MSIAADPRVEVKDAGPTPWRFLPVLYVMQAIPVTIVQELMTIVYKDFGVGNEAITKWTSLIALPWSLQMFLGPMVDLTGTKRAWTIRGRRSWPRSSPRSRSSSTCRSRSSFRC